MNRLFLAFVLFCASLPAMGGEAVTVGQAINMAAALRNLDGHQVVVKQAGAETVILVPWEFGSGVLRMKIASNLAVLSSVEKRVEDARTAIIKEVGRGKPVAPGSQEMDDIMRQFNEVLAQPEPRVADLARIKSADLRLDKNEIPASTLAALMPILDQ